MKSIIDFNGRAFLADDIKFVSKVYSKNWSDEKKSATDEVTELNKKHKELDEKKTELYFERLSILRDAIVTRPVRRFGFDLYWDIPKKNDILNRIEILEGKLSKIDYPEMEFDSSLNTVKQKLENRPTSQNDCAGEIILLTIPQCSFEQVVKPNFVIGFSNGERNLKCEFDTTNIAEEKRHEIIDQWRKS